MKRILNLLSVITLLYCFSGCEPDNAFEGDVYSAVPKNASVILEVANLQKALQTVQQTEIYSGLDSLPFVLGFAKDLNELTQNFEIDSLAYYAKSSTILMVAALSGAEKYDLLFIGTGNTRFEKSIGKKLAKAFKFDSKTYSDAEIFHFFNTDKSKNYYISSYQGLILLSTNGNLLEESIRQVKSEFNIRQDVDFNRLLETANQKDLANLYINLEESVGLFQNLLPKANAQFLTKMGSWIEMDVQIDNEEILMSGLGALPSNKAWYPQSFNGVSAKKLEGQNIVPVSTGLWISHTFENAEQYNRNYRDYLEKAGRLRKHDQLLEKLEFDAHELLLQWVDTEMGLFGSADKKEQGNYIAYFSYRSEEGARESLEKLAGEDFIEGYRGIIIKKMKAENALARLHGNLFQDFHYPYYAITNGFVLFAENLPMLKGAINDILAGKTLGQDAHYNEFSENFPSKAHVNVIVSNPGFLPMLNSTLEKEESKILEQQQNKLNDFRWAAFQMRVDGDKAFTNFYASHSKMVKEKVSRQWSTQLESQAASVPQFLKNYVNKKYDIAVQDKDHRLYLLNYDGKILWTKILDGPIMGGITQVDIFKNNKLQMALNTASTLYVIDRLGRDVENFPVALDQAATAPMGVANYDRARNYRFLVPTGKMLMNYDISGKPVKGWKFKKTKDIIITQPQHFAVKGKDLIVLESEDGKLYQINRAGKTRFETIEDLPSLRIPFYLKKGESLAESEMITIADDGKLYLFRPGGLADNVYLDAENPAEEFLYFDDKYIFSSEEKLFVKSNQKPWSVSMDGDISTKPKAMIFRGDFYAGAFSEDAEEIRLYTKKGELIEGFPVFAQGPFDMGSLKSNSTINIVTYSEDGTLICYRVN